MSDKITVARCALHAWEEPVISGTRGSGTIFFTGCSLGCVFCQNEAISRGRIGKSVDEDRLVDVMFELREQGAHNINFVTPTHFAPSVKEAVISARKRGLDLPTVYNTSSYDSVETIRSLDGIIDVYLADFKYYRQKTAEEVCGASDYPFVARMAIAEMVRQVPKPIIKNGIMQSGVIVRVLLLPAHVAEAKLICKYLYSEYGDNIYISLMNQYTPMKNMKSPLDRRVTRAEYHELVSYAQNLGIKLAFTQEFGTAVESFIPDFNLSGV